MKLWINKPRELDHRRYTWAGTLGTAVLLGGGTALAIGAANKSNKKQVAPALKAPPTLSATAEYPLYKSTLEDRIAGRNLGYDPSVLNSATAPYATQQRQNFQNYTVPQISGQASARGLGRSTIPVSQARLGSQEVESDIANRVAQLTLANEQEKASEKTGAISSYGNLMGSDYNSILNNITGQNNQAQAAANAQNTNTVASNQLNQQYFNDILGGGVSLLGGGNNLGSILNPTTSSGAYSDLTKPLTYEDLMKYVNSRGAAVNIK
jgi:hypothetical protein